MKALKDFEVGDIVNTAYVWHDPAGGDAEATVQIVRQGIKDSYGNAFLTEVRVLTIIDVDGRSIATDTDYLIMAWDNAVNAVWKETSC